MTFGSKICPLCDRSAAAVCPLCDCVEIAMIQAMPVWGDPHFDGGCEGLMSYEIEQKFHVDDLALLEQRLAESGACEDRVEGHRDRYFNHPSRDFKESKEALRVRRIDGVPMITYKGPKLPGAVKARLEREWRLDPGDPDGKSTEELLEILGFRPVAVVEKRRRVFDLPGQWADVVVVIDDVQDVGLFAEVELIASNEGAVEIARERIRELSDHLMLQRVEPRSYLSMLLELS